MTRKDFLKKTTLGAVSLLVLSNMNVLAAGSVSVNDNLATGGTYIGANAPSNKKLTWVDTANEGIMKYYDGTEWTPIRSTWDA